MIFEAFGNVVLSKYILIQTIKNTINFETIFNSPTLITTGFLSLGSTLVNLFFCVNAHPLLLDDNLSDYD